MNDNPSYCFGRLFEVMCEIECCYNREVRGKDTKVRSPICMTCENAYMSKNPIETYYRLRRTKLNYILRWLERGNKTYMLDKLEREESRLRNSLIDGSPRIDNQSQYHAGRVDLRNETKLAIERSKNEKNDVENLDETGNS